MKAILEFNLDDPFEREQHENMLKAEQYIECLREFDNELRNLSKYHNVEEIGVDDVRSKLSTILDRRGLSIW